MFFLRVESIVFLSLNAVEILFAEEFFLYCFDLNLLIVAEHGAWICHTSEKQPQFCPYKVFLLHLRSSWNSILKVKYKNRVIFIHQIFGIQLHFRQVKVFVVENHDHKQGTYVDHKVSLLEQDGPKVRTVSKLIILKTAVALNIIIVSHTHRVVDTFDREAQDVEKSDSSERSLFVFVDRILLAKFARHDRFFLWKQTKKIDERADNKENKDCVACDYKFF